MNLNRGSTVLAPSRNTHTLHPHPHTPPTHTLHPGLRSKTASAAVCEVRISSGFSLLALKYSEFDPVHVQLLAASSFRNSCTPVWSRDPVSSVFHLPRLKCGVSFRLPSPCFSCVSVSGPSRVCVQTKVWRMRRALRAVQPTGPRSCHWRGMVALTWRGEDERERERERERMRERG